MKEEKALKPLYIVGAGGFGREVAWLVERINSRGPAWALAGFIDDDAGLWGTDLGGCPILGGCGYLAGLEGEYYVVCAAGNPLVRRKIVERLSKVPDFAGLHFAVLVDPGAVISSRVSLGEGTIICAGTIITVDVSIGSHCIINLDCTIGHDAILEDYVTLYPSVNLSGAVKAGHTTELGTGTQVIQGVKIGSGSIIGAGSVVIRDLESSVTAVGSPAKVIKRR